MAVLQPKGPGGPFCALIKLFIPFQLYLEMHLID